MAESEFIERRLITTESGRLDTRRRNIDRSQDYIDVQKRGKTYRIYGTQEQLDQYQNKKPDGTQKQAAETQTAVQRGQAKKAKKEEGAVNKVKEGKGDVDTSTETTSGTAGVNLQNIVANPLERFASINYLWTLAVLTPDQFNNPLKYRQAEGLSFGGQSYDVKSKYVDDDGGFGTKTTTLKSGIVFSSAGRGDEFRTETAFGTPEYYLDNFEMKAVVAANVKTGNQNAIEFTFDIYEPYSMGLLLQSLQVAAINAGYTNYLDSPFLLKLDFRGFSDSGIAISSIKSKFFILKLTDLQFSVDESGSKYNVTGIPYNFQGYSDTVDTIFTDVNIRPTSTEETKELNDDTKPGSVKDILARGPNSLISYLNKLENKNVADGKYLIPDEYEIHFPKSSSERLGSLVGNTEQDQGATINLNGTTTTKVVGGQKSSTNTANIGNNEIGNSDFGFDVGQGGNFPFKNDKDVLDKETGRIIRGKMQIDETKREFHFTQKQRLTDIITQTILQSTFAKEATQKATTADGFINWFKLDTQVEFLDYDTKAGDFAKRYIYRVVPFKVHSSVFGNPNAVPPGYNELEKQIVKRYDYIYTGQNVDILNFDIRINYLFYSGQNPAKESQTKDDVNQDNKSTVEETANKTETGEGSEKSAQTANLGKSKIKRDPNTFSLLKGGPGTSDVKTRVAEAFQQAFVNTSSADLIEVDLEIMGDTFWLVDSGLSNYFAAESAQSPQQTEDGTMNYESSDVYIYISFRTPADINTRTGLVEFSYKDKESPFSGIYRVTECTNNFSKGQFTQTLKCIRMQGQPQDYDGKNKTVEKSADGRTIKITEKEDPKTNTSQVKISNDGKRVIGGI